MSQKLKDKVAVITGGSSGIGLGIAKRFAEEGAKVAITGRNQQTINEALVEIGPNGLGIQGDVSNLNDLTRIYQTVEEKFGKVDILIANAGVYVLGPLADFTEEQFDKVSDINFKGAFFSVQKALPVLKDGASVVLVSSTVNGKGIPNHAAYSATKAAVRSLARSFSADLLERKIRVNALTPGPVDTPVFNTITTNPEEAKAMKESFSNFTPVKRIGSAEELAAAALYLASDDSAFMLGAELLLDGGLRDL
ncbi:NAD(P)-dependent dehydrogenase (short-subunit alcohol dehydrogenase family) [Pedobacter cryoconitis]|uniref:NAD(P)-dependent dehydrogenase (Short-subunit alcohol dehydrogenase family) n=1 Tax=Pedobacter cryoconitis TaxID=188932 RepID=A0A7W8YUB0_9SPHI|nr:glucose 1-dehydrogenase [Pedobacter cryoconitis]MBB5621961.1 NAD(P)-dependent dehydrogenase (short-subunit alcohol dehydrogenase family) [Pedobacter cryoconitis]MBB5643935.1 NAD(P)-dependent dehydrogenase (short-subunit alcohol dehydrogenase family) [Pedobacter cryoconitis]